MARLRWLTGPGRPEARLRIRWLGLLLALLLWAPAACRPETSLTIRWSVENEIDVAGYNLYRADTATGDPVRINDEPIPPSIDPVVGTEHRFVDRKGIVRGRTYYYWLETIHRAGTSTREGPFAIQAD